MKEITYEDIKRVNEEIKMTDIGRGKEYAEVPRRVEAFRKLHPNGSITSEIISLENGVVVMKSTAADENGNILGTGHAYEKEGNGFINKFSFIENCETSSWGRALAACGIIGGEDASIASAEEVMNAKKQQHKEKEDKLKADLKKLLEDTNSNTEVFLKWATEQYERPIKAVDEMYDKEIEHAIKTIKEQKGVK